MKEKKKLNFIGFWPGFDKTNNLFCDILQERFDIEISDQPDYLIASVFGDPMQYLEYDCVRILFTGEPLVPDFNLFDYAIGFDYLSFPDQESGNRYYRYPLCFYNYKRLKKHIYGMSFEEAKNVLAQKQYFCNFLYGHQSAKGERERIFHALEQYKRVESAGSFLNNMPDGLIIPYSEKKMDFLKLCKFTIACESISYPGFVTEKLINPFYSDSVPIYYGNRLVNKEFNDNAMINLHQFSSLEEGMEKVIEVDQNDALFIQMLMEPKLISSNYLDNLLLGLKEFLFSIVSQMPEQAYRRMRFYIQKEHESYLNEYRKFSKSVEYRIYKKIHPKTQR